MGLAVGAHQPGAVDRETHRQFLDRDIMYDLVIGALQKGRINRRERLHPLSGKTSGEGHGVLLGDPDIEGSLRKFVAEEVEPGAGRHRSRDRDDAVVGFGFLDQRFGKHRSVGGGDRLALDLGARDHIEFGDAMVLVFGLFSRQVAAALLGNGVDQDRAALLGVADILQHGQQMVDVVAVDRPDIIKAQLLEQGAAGNKAAGEFLGAPRGVLERLGEVSGDLLGDVAQRQERFRR